MVHASGANMRKTADRSGFCNIVTVVTICQHLRSNGSGSLPSREEPAGFILLCGAVTATPTIECILRREGGGDAALLYL